MMERNPPKRHRRFASLILLLAALSAAASGQTTNEMVLPIVVNGAVAEQMHYQSIFTILNASGENITATLQIYNKAGTPTGVFCVPVPPPPSSATVTLQSNAQFFQFTSAALPFFIGWARVRWDGPLSVLASVELTQIATAPAPCLLVCNRPSTEKLSSAQMSAIKPAKEFHLPITINPNRETALALINPSATQAVTVTISLFNTAGQSANLGIPSSFQITVRPLTQISDFIWQLALDHAPSGPVVSIPQAFQGSAVLTADAPFAVGALNMMFPQNKFVAVPVISPLP